jgi:hypothetical protein
MVVLTAAALYRANQGLLRQKMGLIQALVSRHGVDQAKAWYKETCPIVKASIGQHVRHSMDHMERAAEVVAMAASSKITQTKSSTVPPPPPPLRIQYDTRQRGNQDEHDMDAASARIESVQNLFQQMLSNDSDNDTNTSLLLSNSNQTVEACFMLSGDSNDEFALPSTLARELGFAAHHAIHHLALVRIIAINTAGLLESDLPLDFGRAPSTVNHDHETLASQSGSNRL